MAKYNWQELLALWERSELTEAQAIGQLLQWGIELDKLILAFPARLERLEKQAAQLEKRLDGFAKRFDRLTSRFDALQRRLEILEVAQKPPK